MTRNRSGDVFAIAALLVLIMAVSAAQQGGALGWTFAALAVVFALISAAMAWLRWTAPRDEDDQL
jgi:membrane protein implicated in regulation of membrane protease activity